MKDRVKIVRLNNVTLDIEELTQYDGQGRCSEIRVRRHTRRRYGGARLREWTADKVWRVTGDNDMWLEMERSPSKTRSGLKGKQR